MSVAEPRFADYGDDGDLAGARRSRRSFRLTVTSVILITIFAWGAEYRLRYPLPEQHFKSAITLPYDSARVFLQAAIKQDANVSDTPTAKYTQALAVRQPDDVALDTYAQGLLYDPKNSLFAIRYGCRLLALNQPAKAVEMFRTARALPPSNSLPRYLEAAATAKGSRNDMAALGEAMVIVSRANNTREPIQYPKPIWFSGYPQSGSQYATISREIFAESSAPFMALTQQVALVAQRNEEPLQGQDVKTWLHQIETMGRRLVNQSDPKGTIQAIAGVTIQLQALQTLKAVLEREGDPDPAEIQALVDREVLLRQALDVLNEFEANRDNEIDAIQNEYVRPIWLLFISALCLVGVYLLSRVVHAVLRYRKSAWTVPHSSLGKAILAIGPLAFFSILTAIGLLQRVPGSQEGYLDSMSSVWWGVLAVLIGFGFIYPALRVPSAEEVSGKSGRLEDMPDVIRHARQARRRVYIAFIVRYFGILSGVFWCIACVWIVLYRVANGLYPWQFNLLGSGMLGRELEVVRQVIAMLGPQ